MSSKAPRAFLSRIQKIAHVSIQSSGIGRAFGIGTAAPGSAVAPEASFYAHKMLKSCQQPHARSFWLPAPGTPVQSRSQSQLEHLVRPPSSSGGHDGTPRSAMASSRPPTALPRQQPACGRLVIHHRAAGTAIGGADVGYRSHAGFAGLGFSSSAGVSPLHHCGRKALSGGSDGPWGGRRSERSTPFVEKERRSFGVLRRRKPDDDDSKSEVEATAGAVPPLMNGTHASSEFDLPLRPGPFGAAVTEAERKSEARELHTVNVAISTNFAIFLAKLGVFSFTGSNALLAEAIHSLADVANQALLWMGINRSKKAPTKLHPYGYMRDKFVFSLISAVGIFCLGAGVSLWNGVSGIIAAAPVEHIGWSVGVLGLSMLLEGYSLLVACRSVQTGAEAAGVPFLEYVRRGTDPTSVAVMLEDAGAVAGLIIAGSCMALVHFTGAVVWDSIGSICVGGLMGATAWFLISRNRQMLIGRSMDQADLEAIIKHLQADPVVRAVYDAKSEEIGPGIFRFKAEIDFSGEDVVERHMARQGREALMQGIRDAAQCRPGSSELDAALKEYGRAIISSVGAEVDRIESDIQRLNPGVRYVDLETDRGQAGAKPFGLRTSTLHAPKLKL